MKNIQVKRFHSKTDLFNIYEANRILTKPFSYEMMVQFIMQLFTTIVFYLKPVFQRILFNQRYILRYSLSVS